MNEFNFGSSPEQLLRLEKEFLAKAIDSKSQ
jgi:hypothetical protein